MDLLDSVVTLRPIEEDDVAALQRNCWPERTRDDVRIRMAHTITPNPRRKAYGVVGLINDEAIAYGQLSCIGRRFEICNLIVSESWRSRGIGTSMINYLLELARHEDVTEVEIGVAQSNPRALELYERLGFEKVRETKMYLGQVEPQTVYYLSLPLTDDIH